MKKGETLCYYRSRGGERNIYIAVFYEKDKLIESIIETKAQPIIKEVTVKKY